MANEYFNLAVDLKGLYEYEYGIANQSVVLLARYQHLIGNEETVKEIEQLKSKGLSVAYHIKEEWKVIERMSQEANKRELRNLDNLTAAKAGKKQTIV